ncbi:LCP family protein [Micromonospora sp. NPDC002389]|uniref:LCP family protein n=1 Tax=Micromonospora sp. NPDC002389 TaxID=3154272 RepID=UPI003330A2C8
MTNDIAPASIRRRLTGWQKATIALVALLGVACAGLVTLGVGLKHRYESRVQREDILGQGTAPRDDERWAEGPLNLLLLGSDSREGEPDQGLYPGQRSDTIMLVHLNAARDAATVVSIPRDSYVDVPAREGSWAGGKNKINAALAFGGASLAAETVHRLTGVTIDGVLVANFAAVRQIVDAIGGITVCLPYEVLSTDTGTRWSIGCHQLDGRNTDDLMRQRHHVPGGDFGRIQNQQFVVRAIVEKVTSENLLTDPARLDRVLTTTAESLTVDRDLDLTELVLAVRRISAASLRFVTAPAADTDLTTPAGSSVLLDEELSAALFTAVREDRLDEWFASRSATSAPN